MSVLRLLNVNGDERVEWDPAVVDDRMRRARLLFEAKLRSGWFAYEAKPGGTGSQLQRFDPKADEIVVQPPIAGG
jgi:hypothetical protein